MRRSRTLLEATSTRSLCTFCASRSLTDKSPVVAAAHSTSTFPVRWLTTERQIFRLNPDTGSTREETSQIASRDDEQVLVGSYSTLTAAEQQAKEQRRVTREAKEARTQQSLVRRVVAVQQPSPSSRELQQGKASSSAPHQHDDRFQKRVQRVPNLTSRHSSGKDAIHTRPLIRKHTVNSRVRESMLPQSRFQAGPNRNRRDTSAQPASLSRSVTEVPPVETISKPTFGSSVSLYKVHEIDQSGWGASSGEIKPLEYIESGQISSRPQNLSENTSNADSGQLNTSLRGLAQSGVRQEIVGTHGNGSLQLRPKAPGSSHSDYQAVPFNAEEFSSPSQIDDLDQSKTWKFLGPQQTDFLHNKSEVKPASNDSLSPFPSRLDDRAINEGFKRHKLQRNPSRSAFRRVGAILEQQEPDELNKPTLSQIKCARCLEYGHRAAECVNAARHSCHVCGEIGHYARECRQPNSSHKLICHSCGQKGHVASECHTKYSIQSEEHHQSQEGLKAPKHNYYQPLQRARSMPESKPVTHEPRYQNGTDSQRGSEDQPERSDRRGRVSRWESDAGDNGDQLVTGRRDRKKLRRSSALREDDMDEDDSGFEIREARAARKAARKAEKEKRSTAAKAGRLDAGGERLNLPDFISVSNLAQLMGIRYEAFVAHLGRLGYEDIFPGMILNSEMSGMIAMEYNFEPVYESSTLAAQKQEYDLQAAPAVEDYTELPPRPPVVTIMGHVDHGKTTILDYLRKSSVAAGEAGGITQHIGAFSVPLASSGKTITFLDTPGHAAFLAMRQRGANVTDIVVLVVAADDSVKPQTLEAVRHARAANVPIIVAINKIDKAEADAQKVKLDLARHGIEVEDFGGDTQVVLVSGKTGQGLSSLEDAIVTLSEVLDHRAAKDGVIEGWILEGTTTNAGRIATMLVRRGTLQPGAILVAGKTWTRVRTLKNEAGQLIDQVGPGMPVEIDGWRDQPVAGDEVLEAPTEQKATSVIEYRLESEEREKVAADMDAINEARRTEQRRRLQEKSPNQAMPKSGNLASTDAEGLEPADATGQIVVPFIIKADVSGSAEALAAYVLSVSSPMITPRVLLSGVGKVNEGDIELASAAEGHIISFNNAPDEGMKAQAAARGVQILENNIIYRIVEKVKELFEDKLPPIVAQRVVGEAEISALFDIKLSGRKTMKIAGCKVRNGVVKKNSRARVLRGTEKVYDGLLSSLKNVKKDVQEMRKGTECGIAFDEWDLFEIGDQIQTYEEVSEKRKLNL